ncbi:MAG: 5'-3' exonuclease H3TH domain-containing protein [Patescibacteria group bacterium]
MKESDVTEKFGVPAHQVCDYLAIVGDSSDNIPGISGFGPKKAVDLLSKYETLEGIYEHLEELTPKMQDVLLAQKENAFLSQKLATIDTSLIIDNLEEIPFAPGLQELQYRDILKMYEFKSLFPQVPASELAPARSIDVVDISTYEKLLQIHRDILGNSIPMIVSVDEYGKMVFSIQGVIYRIDTKKVDVGDFIEDIINEKIPLI